MVRDVSEELITLRRELHRYPELSGREKATAERIKAFLSNYPPDQLIESIGGHGLVAIYEFDEPGPAVLVRCELDALPIDEANTFGHRSRNTGVSHKCGHDGHMTLVAGLAPYLNSRPFRKGKVMLLFQPAEENGLGAKAMLDDPKFQSVRPDFVFALHNIPGFPLHQIIQVKDQFSATVKSVAIHLEGQQSHAAEPEKGRNPAWGMAEITQQLQAWVVADEHRPDFTLITPVYTSMGQTDYGISAGRGELHFTLRTWSVPFMDELVGKLEALVESVGAQYALKSSLAYFDYFPATPNDAQANRYIETAAQQSGLELTYKKLPFKFGEDFGWFARRYPGAMFGLGAGMDTPVLHNEHYDFPEALISSGISIFRAIIQNVLEA